MTEPRITIDPDVMVGAPCISGTRIPVVTVLRTLAAGLNPLADFPELTRDDVAASLLYAADVLDVDDDAPRWFRMSVTDLLDMDRDVIGLRNPDGSARAFVLKALPVVVQFIEDITMRADVPPGPAETFAGGDKT